MIRRLTRIELQGYKTFAANTNIEFGDVTCIVGPNGSGKSNIADGVRWVLGEQSFSLLRGRKTADMIFSGSEERSRASMASATIVFDNSDGWLPIDFAEVSLTRRAYRDGQNEYLINGQKTRLRDVTDLLGTVGLAQRTYTVIGQGLVDTALSIKAGERRKLFEEAAGIGVYRQKREDAIRKLDQTQRNVERVSDILAEIRPRLRALDRQARRARDFKQVQQDLHHLLRTWYGYHWQNSQDTYAQSLKQLEYSKKELSELWEEQEAQVEKIAKHREEVAAKRSQVTKWHNEAAKLHENYQSHYREIAVAEERARNIKQQRDTIESELISFRTNLELHSSKMQEAESNRKELMIERDKARHQFTEAQSQSEEQQHKLSQLKKQEADALLNTANLKEQLLTFQAKHKALSDNRQHISSDIKESERDLTESDLHVQTLATKLANLENKNKEAQVELGSATSKRNNLSKTLHGIRTEVEQIGEKLTAANDESERLQTKQKWISHQRIGEDKGSTGLEIIRRAAEKGTLQSYIGTVAEIITVDQDLETAIGAALGKNIQAIFLENYSSVDFVKELLEKHGGRATILPLDKLRVQKSLLTVKTDGFIGWATDLIKCDKQYRDAISILLSNTAICADSSSAQIISKQLPFGAMAVTRDGEVYYANGPAIVGKAKEADVLVLARETRNLPDQIDAANAKRDALSETKNKLVSKLRETRDIFDDFQPALDELMDHELNVSTERDATVIELERAQSHHNWIKQMIETLQARLNKIDEEILTGSKEIELLTIKHLGLEKQSQEFHDLALAVDTGDISSVLTSCQTDLAVAERALKDAETRDAELHYVYKTEIDRIDTRKSQLKILDLQMSDIETNITKLSEYQRKSQQDIAKLQQLIEPEENTIHALEIKMVSDDGPESKFRDTIHNMEHRHAQAQLELQRQQDHIDSLQTQINDDFGLADIEFGEKITGSVPLPFNQIVERLDYVSELPDDIDDSINQLRIQMRRIGGINPDAMKEYDEVKDRHEHLSSQIEDLDSASNQLRQVISELDELMQREFRNTFDAVAKEFEITFKRLFDGGSGRLELDDENDLSNTGVEIIAQLPGRRQQGLAALSGGERALIACALVFALLRVSPTPFALLDEVDAMLDESNVGRFRSILREISQNTQFVLITHNRHTVEVADTVYGINMSSDSSSQVISLKPDEVI